MSMPTSKIVELQTKLNDGLQELLDVLPVWIQDAALLHIDTLEEIAIDLGRYLVVHHAHGYTVSERTVTKDDLNYIIHRVHGFREDNRTGIDKTRSPHRRHPRPLRRDRWYHHSGRSFSQRSC